MDNNQSKLQNKGYLYRNKRKNKQTQPDMTGKVNWKGEEIMISGWEKTSPTGEKYLSIALSEKLFRPEGESNSTLAPEAQGSQNWSAQRANPAPNANPNSNSQSSNYSHNKSTSNHPDNDLEQLNSLFGDDQN